MGIRSIALVASTLALSTSVNAAIITDNFVYGNTVNDFDGLSTGAVAGLISQSGASYGELFTGQTLDTSGGFDSLSGTPTSTLNLKANASIFDNVGIFSTGGSNTIYGDLNSETGEGAVSILLDTETNIFGFNILGGNDGQFLVDFFGSDGGLIGSFSQTATNSFFGFRVDSGTLISAVSITNTDYLGLAYDNFTFNSTVVPIPAAVWLFGSGLLGLVGVARRKNS